MPSNGGHCFWGVAGASNCNITGVMACKVESAVKGGEAKNSFSRTTDCGKVTLKNGKSFPF